MHQIIRKVLLLAVLQQSVICHEECAVEERLVKYNLEHGGGRVIANYTDMENRDECYQACCKLAKTDGCNAASFFRYHNQVICLSIQCEPHFSNCTWEDALVLHDGYSAEIKLYDSSVPIPGNATQSNTTVKPEEVQEYVHDIQDELQEKKDDIFQNDNPLEKWKVDYKDIQNLVDEGTTTQRWNDDITTTQWMGFKTTQKQEQQTESENTNKPEDHETKKPAKIQNQIINKPPPDNIANKIDKPHIAHGNSGIYGPHEVEDYDYSATPLIVIGAVITVLFLLMVLICVGRKLSKSERLKYRPLRDSFPASNSYHDME